MSLSWADLMDDPEFYPFSKFLVNGKPLIIWEERVTEQGEVKRSKNNVSLKQFQAFLGLGRAIEQSGDKTKKSRDCVESYCKVLTQASG